MHAGTLAGGHAPTAVEDTASADLSRGFSFTGLRHGVNDSGKDARCGLVKSEKWTRFSP